MIGPIAAALIPFLDAPISSQKFVTVLELVNVTRSIASRRDQLAHPLDLRALRLDGSIGRRDDDFLRAFVAQNFGQRLARDFGARNQEALAANPLDSDRRN